MGKSAKGKKEKNLSTKPLSNISLSNISSSQILYEKNKIRKKNPNISFFNLDSNFIYEPRYCSHLYRLLKNAYNMKLNINDLSFIEKYAEKIMPNNDLNNKNNYIDIPEDIYLYFEQRVKIYSKGDEKTRKIKDLIDCLNGIKISCRKLAELYISRYKEKISKTVVNQILKNKLGYKFLKLMLKIKLLQL